MKPKILLPVLGIVAGACSRPQSAPEPVVTSQSQAAAPSAAAPSAAAPSAAAPSAPSPKTYLQRLAVFRTKLLRTGPAPQEYDARERPPAGVREVTYPSDGMELKAWFAVPSRAKGKKAPGVVYFHGGFAFGRGDFNDARPFLDAGFVVMCPMLRGENGNPGTYEMFLAEVRDAKAAIAWLGSQPDVDASRLYTFGHSAGGIVSSLLSLHDVSIRHGGSIGALYDPRLFDWMSSKVPFALDDPDERHFRLLIGNIASMQHRHYAFVGDADSGQAPAVALKERGQEGLLDVATVRGDHNSSVREAASAYVKVIEKNP